MKDFTRILWVSEQARSVWEGRLYKIHQYLLEMERLACKMGRVAIQFIYPDKLPELVLWAQKENLIVLPLDIESGSSSYRSSSSPYVNGLPWTMRVAITPPEHVDRMIRAWREKDEIEIGNRLGYPPCCRRFFDRVWRKERKIDTTWDMYSGNAQGPIECNILLRWLGARLVPHLPCSFACRRTVDFANSFNDESRQEYEWICEMLSWPVEWSALHGIARIKTPICEVMTRTDYTAEKKLVRRLGDIYPKEAARAGTPP